MKFKVLIAAIILALALPAAAQFRTVSKAHEVRLSDLRLPQSDGGTVAYKPCDECPYETKRQEHAARQVQAQPDVHYGSPQYGGDGAAPSRVRSRNARFGTPGQPG
jgi:hypothetical protein